MSEIIFIPRGGSSCIFMQGNNGVKYFAREPRTSLVYIGGTKGDDGADGTNGGYTDLEISDDIVAEFNYQYRVNSPDKVYIQLPSIGVGSEGKSFRIISVGMGGAQLIIPTGVAVYLSVSGMFFGDNGIDNPRTIFLPEYNKMELFVTGASKWLADAAGVDPIEL